MTSERHDIWQVADALQMDLRAASAKLVELRGRLAGLELPAASSVTCPQCGLKCRGKVTLEEHLYVSHDGPLPEVYRRIDNLVEETKL